MAEGISASNLNLTPEEKRIYGQLFKQADTDGLGLVTGDVAVQFFERTRLDHQTLGAIWQIADPENRGFLTPAQFSVVLRLIGHCQSGSEPSTELAQRFGTLPRFDGLSLPGQPQVPAALQAQTSGGSGPIPVPRLAPEKITEYSALFERAGARNGVLSGESAKDVFQRSGLSNETLGRVWALADPEGSGEFNRTQFIVAMHLLASLRTGAMRTVPQTVPPALFEVAARRVPPQAASAIPRQYSGQASQRTPISPSRQAFNAQPLSTESTGNDWLVSPQQKANFDNLFTSLDTTGTGFLSGDHAVEFFSRSGLSKDILAAIWDLSEIRSEGQLNREEFAVAMYLIQQQKKDSKIPLPAKLPLGLVPPSMRRQGIASPVARAPPVNMADPFASEPPKPKSASEDLFGLDAMSSDDPPAKNLQTVNKAAEDPFATGSLTSSPLQPQTSGLPSVSGKGTTFRPFVPTSTFGQGLAAQDTGSSFQSAGSQFVATPTQSFPQSQGADDLLGDTDPEVNKKLTQETTELANMSNQIGTLRTQMQEVQSKKAGTEREVAASKSQKAELESRLSQFRTQYEQEVREVKTLEEQLYGSRTETQKLQKELGMIQGSHADLKAQHERLTTALNTDQQENASLKERIRVLNAEVSELKPQLEKLKSESRQQKGLVAINKKQVSTTEAERDRLQGDVKAEEKTIADLTASQAAQQEQQRSRVASPAGSVGSQSTNPFFRQAAQQSSDRLASPLASPPVFASANATSFDDFFGPSSTQAESTKAAPPVTSFPEPAAGTSAEHSTSGFTTPTMSPAPTPQHETPAIEPPPPPESRQITSNSLPLSTLARTESFSSSVKANPPASRGVPSGVATPNFFSGSPSASVNGEKVPSSEPKAEAAPTSVPMFSDPIAESATDNDRAATTVAHDVSIPGAFPGESPITATTPSGNIPEIHPPSSEAAASSGDPGPGASDQTIHQEGTSKVVAPAAGTSRSTAGFDDIQFLDDDDDSSDTEEEEPERSGHTRGFSDAFAPTEQNQAAESAKSDLIPPPQSDAQSEHSQLPTPTAQNSPPSYTQTVTNPEGERRESNQFPPEFGGLLPSREISHSPPTESTTREAAMFPTVQTATNGTASALPTVSSSTTIKDETPSTATRDEFSDAFQDLSESKVEPKDDFESAFDDLTESNEADDVAHEAFGAGRDDHEFNANFESPAPSKSTTFSFQTTPPAVVAHSANASNDFSGFMERAGAADTPKASAQAVPNEFDSLFKDFDKTPDLAVGTSTDKASPFDSMPGASLGRPPLPQRGPSYGEDDDYLKQLTSMGYTRDVAVKALEKYDYDIERAADSLAKRSTK